MTAEGGFKYASSKWFMQAIETLAASGVHGVAVDVWVSSHFWYFPSTCASRFALAAK